MSRVNLKIETVREQMSDEMFEKQLFFKKNKSDIFAVGYVYLLYSEF